MARITEATLEEAALEWLRGLGWETTTGSALEGGQLFSERASRSEVLLQGRLQAAIERLNPDLPAEAHEEALRTLKHLEGADLLQSNRTFHRYLTVGVPVEYRIPTGELRGAQVQLIHWHQPDQNDWLVVRQFPVVENRHRRRPDLVLFVNGLPLAVMELKNPADSRTSVFDAYHQLKTYWSELPSLFQYNEVLVVSDGTDARVGPIGAGPEHFRVWRLLDGEPDASEPPNPLEGLLKGLFRKEVFLAYVKNGIVFEQAGGGQLVKKIAAYHQFDAARKAVERTLALRRAAQSGLPKESRIGVVWHTQGSGKSLTMLFYVGWIVREPEMANPTVVVLTDRNDLDDQLFGTFARCADSLGQTPVQAESRLDLQKRLAVPSGGIVFTTIQKFLPEEKGARYPCLSDRSNIIVIADEAHRSQYDFIDGFARHLRDALPNALFIGFTGTPIEKSDRNTRAVFGDYIAIYDIEQAVKDGATVPIYYESRLAKLSLPEAYKPKIDEAFEELTESEEQEEKEKLKKKWAQLEVIVGAEPRIREVARDIVEHFERRCEVLEGKGMIVCMSRRICVALYEEIIRLRPAWHSDRDEEGVLKVVMTGSAKDPPEWQMHIRTKERRERLADRFRDPKDPFRLVIVRDMWLTGFDCPSLHTLYIDKPMQGHTLMQAIARVNRVFRDKPAGLVVDYLGLVGALRQALAVYTESGGRGAPALDQEEAVREMRTYYEVCRDMFSGFDYSAALSGDPRGPLVLLPAAQEHILQEPEGKKRFTQAVRALTRAFVRAVPHEEALRLRAEIAFFQAVAAAFHKQASPTPSANNSTEVAYAIRQLVSQAIAPEGVIDVFAAAGLHKPDISILSEEFLAEVKRMPHKHLAVEVLQKLLRQEIRQVFRKNVVQERTFSERLEELLERYQKRIVDVIEVVEALIGLAREMRESAARGEKLHLTPEEVAFYDALAASESAQQLLGDVTLRQIAQELTQVIRANVTIDWMYREQVRADLRKKVKRLLRKYNYPPDKTEKATDTVLEQAEVLAEAWAA
ncbi:MAG: type I restriction endonuclease subunit R [Bacteroidia bacterium]|nr:type I restriction endonuclease subunit R [Bacteroidia bacterium]GIV23775.1 MAG: DEAD/DEAH box helicase [Bacteroidia bacterium]